MNWMLDPVTAKAAAAYPLRLVSEAPASQFGGRKFHPPSWDYRVVQPSSWPSEPLRSSPEQIITQFQHGRYTQGLALVVSWGTMGRTNKRVWARSAKQIEQTLQHCATTIEQTKSIDAVWPCLTGNQENQLGWTAVMASKTLHFLCRALGFEHDPPVALDGEVMRKQVWPEFRDQFHRGQRPGNWLGDDFDAYCRYMTAILTWAQQRGWTTTQLEATIFDQYRSPQDQR